MAFISQSRLTRTATGTAASNTPLDPPQQIARFNGIVRDILNAFGALPGNQRPNANERGGYELRYDIRCSIEGRVLGVTDDNRRLLVVLYRVWPTQAARLAGDPPAFINSHLFARPKAGTPLGAYIREHMRDAIERASLSGNLGDQRDFRIRATENDPTGFYTDADVVQLRSAVIEVDTAVTNPSSAPLRTNPETGQ